MVPLVLAAALAIAPAEPIPLHGFGLVIGLEGTGSDCTFTTQIACNWLEACGLPPFLAAPLGSSLAKSRSVSAVMVWTDHIPGVRCDVLVSPIDDARSLDGGMLIGTGLRQSDGRQHATAQGVLEPQAKKIAKVVNGAKAVTVRPTKT